MTLTILSKFKNGGHHTRISSDKSKRSTLLCDRLTAFFLLWMALIFITILSGLWSPRSSGLLLRSEFKDDQTSEPLHGTQELASFDEYAPLFSNRDIFKTEVEQIEAETARLSGQNLSTWGAEYKLVGVMVDDQPRAVVEILNPPSVLFLSVGERLGDAVLEKIEAKGVWFRFQGQQIQLNFEGGVVHSKGPLASDLAVKP